MADIVCACISAVSVIIVAVIGTNVKHSESLAKERAEESLLLLKLMNANCDLTVGTAMALKSGHCNGEMEKGLETVKAAQSEYEAFHARLVITQLSK